MLKNVYDQFELYATICIINAHVDWLREKLVIIYNVVFAPIYSRGDKVKDEFETVL